MRIYWRKYQCFRTSPLVKKYRETHVHEKYVNTVTAVTTGTGLKQLKRLVIRLHLLIPLLQFVFTQ